MKKEIMLPNQLIKELSALVKKEAYVGLYSVFPEVIPDDLEYLVLDLGAANDLLSVAQIELSKAGLKYPYHLDDEHPFDPEHEERFDDIQDFSEKIHYYLGLGIEILEAEKTLNDK